MGYHLVTTVEIVSLLITSAVTLAQEGKILKLIGKLGPYSQCFIFFVNYEWANQARVFHYPGLERLVRDKRSSLLGSFLTYEENEVLLIQPLMCKLDLN